MSALAAHNRRLAGNPSCPCCLDDGAGPEVRLEPVGPGIWRCAGCRGELGREPCSVVGSPLEDVCSPEGEHYHFNLTSGRISDEPAALA